MSGYDLLLCEMSLPDTGLGAEIIFCTRTFDGVFNDLYRITADGRLFGPVEQVPLWTLVPVSLLSETGTETGHELCGELQRWHSPFCFLDAASECCMCRWLAAPIEQKQLALWGHFLPFHSHLPTWTTLSARLPPVWQRVEN